MGNTTGSKMGRTGSPRHLDAESLAKLANLQLRVRAVVDGALAGLHRNPHHGASIEFSEHRDYSPGDDIRRIDWKAYAKFDRHYIRQYEDETELRAYLLLDCSASMGYGEPLSKLAYGSVLVGSLAYLLSHQRDQPGLVAFADGVQEYVPPRSRSGHLLDVLKVLERVEAAGPTRLERTIDQLIERIGRRALVVVVSDLFDVEASEMRLLRQLRARNHQVVLFHLLHDDELTLPFKDVTLFEAMEARREVLVDPAGLRRAYTREIQRYIEQIAVACKEGEIAHQQVATSQPLDSVLLRLLQHKGARR